jgi:hypothetical protein
MTDETMKSNGSVSLIRENADGSADYQFDFPPEALRALTRLGILTAIQAGIGEAERLNPDAPPPKGEEHMTDEELRKSIAELNDAKTAIGETAQDIEIAEKNITLIRAEMQQEERDAELRVCVKEFFERYLNRVEESDSGKEFYPVTVSCSRALMHESLNALLSKMSSLSGAKPK